jgi:hypothetical protein
MMDRTAPQQRIAQPKISGVLRLRNLFSNYECDCQLCFTEVSISEKITGKLLIPDVIRGIVAPEHQEACASKTIFQ